jgi:hypothetical protein
MKHLQKNILILALMAVVVFLGYRFYEDLKGPIVYTQESAKRDAIIVEKLELIKSAQDAFYQVTKKYAHDFDTLLHVCMKDSFTIEYEQLIAKSEYDPAVHGENPFEYADTSKYRIVSLRRLAIRDSLFRTLDYPVEELRMIPFSQGAPFHIASGSIEAAGGRYTVPTYEVTAPKRFYYAGLDNQYFDPESGYQLGSISEANTDIYPADYVYYPED